MVPLSCPDDEFLDSAMDTGLSPQDMAIAAYRDSVVEFRRKLLLLQEILATKGAEPCSFSLDVAEQTYSVVTKAGSDSIDITLVRTTGDNPAFPIHAHLLIDSTLRFRLISDDLNLTHNQQPLQPYDLPGPEGIDPNLAVRTWLDPFVNKLFIHAIATA